MPKVSTTSGNFLLRVMMRLLSYSRYAAGIVTVASMIDPSELMVFTLECCCGGGLLDGRGSWKMAATPELEEVGVQARLELSDGREEFGKAGESSYMAGIMLSSVIVCPTWCRYRL